MDICSTLGLLVDTKTPSGITSASLKYAAAFTYGVISTEVGLFGFRDVEGVPCDEADSSAKSESGHYDVCNGSREVNEESEERVEDAIDKRPSGYSQLDSNLNVLEED